MSGLTEYQESGKGDKSKSDRADPATKRGFVCLNEVSEGSLLSQTVWKLFVIFGSGKYISIYAK